MIFARGAAELVTDPALTAGPLERPGNVIKLLRGSAEEQLAAVSAPGHGGAKRKARSNQRAVPPRPSAAYPSAAVVSARNLLHIGCGAPQWRREALREPPHSAVCGRPT